MVISVSAILGSILMKYFSNNRHRIIHGYSRRLMDLSLKVKAVQDNNALHDQTGDIVMKDYRGTPVFSAYKPFKFGRQNGSMLVEKDVAEVVGPIRQWWIKSTLMALISYLIV